MEYNWISPRKQIFKLEKSIKKKKGQRQIIFRNTTNSVKIINFKVDERMHQKCPLH